MGEDLQGCQRSLWKGIGRHPVSAVLVCRRPLRKPFGWQVRIDRDGRVTLLYLVHRLLPNNLIATSIDQSTKRRPCCPRRAREPRKRTRQTSNLVNDTASTCTAIGRRKSAIESNSPKRPDLPTNSHHTAHLFDPQPFYRSPTSHTRVRCLLCTRKVK